MRLFFIVSSFLGALLLIGCSSSLQTPSTSPTDPPISGSIQSGTITGMSIQATTGEELSSDITEEEDMIDDSLTVIIGDAEQSCTDEFNQFVTEMINANNEGNETVISYLDLKLIPKLNHCVLGYSTSTQTAYTIIVHNLADQKQLKTFVCEAEYDVTNDILTPCSDTRREALEQEYKAYMSDFVVQTNR